MKGVRRLFAISTVVVLLSACTPKAPSETVRIAINPWPGYEFLYLAQQKGYFRVEGLKVELLELASLADVKRIFEQERADGMASTAIEAVQVASTSKRQVSIVLIPDYSNGGDVVVARAPIRKPADLKGKKVGVELGLLGTYILSRAMQSAGLTANDVIQVNVEQLAAEKALVSGQVDAMVTYTPFSTAIQKHKGFNEIFSTAEIPEEIIDTISIWSDAVDNPKQWQEKFHRAWQRALDFASMYPEEAYRIMAEREGVSVEEFAQALKGMRVLSAQEQPAILGSMNLRANLQRVCETLKQAGELDSDCTTLHTRLNPLI